MKAVAGKADEYSCWTEVSEAEGRGPDKPCPCSLSKAGGSRVCWHCPAMFSTPAWLLVVFTQQDRIWFSTHCFYYLQMSLSPLQTGAGSFKLCLLFVLREIRCFLLHKSISFLLCCVSSAYSLLCTSKQFIFLFHVQLLLQIFLIISFSHFTGRIVQISAPVLSSTSGFLISHVSFPLTTCNSAKTKTNPVQLQESQFFSSLPSSTFLQNFLCLAECWAISILTLAVLYYKLMYLFFYQNDIFGKDIQSHY